jgi:WhiB family transcriptional regulator, redox-sensing transcriptional regulator
VSAAWASVGGGIGSGEGDFVSWQRRGLCQNYPAELFFPEDETRKGIRRDRERLAKRICLDCPVLAICREHAVNAPERHGVWGATTARERAHGHGTDRRPRRTGLAS